MPTYSSKRPVLAIDGADKKFEDDHIKYFFNTKYRQNYDNLTQSEKEEWFQLQKDYGNLIEKIYGEKLYKNVPFLVLAKALKENVNDTSVKEYSDWLEK